VLDPSLPAGFGRAPGGSSSSIINGSLNLNTGANGTTVTSGSTSAGNSSGGTANVGGASGSNNSTLAGSTTAANGSSNTSANSSGANTVNGATSTAASSSKGATTNGSGANIATVTTGTAKGGSAASSNKGAGSLVSVSLDQPPTAGQPGVVSVAVPADLIASGKTVSFALPDALAQAAVGKEVRVSLKNGEALPTWLQYVPDTKSFSISSMASGALPVEVLVKIGDDEWIIVITAKADK
jgi:hypothetical protein